MVKTAIVGLGFLGSYIARDVLSKEDNEVVAIDRLPPYVAKASPVLANFEKDPRFVYKWKSMGDVLDLADEVNTWDNIIITAAIADVPYALANPADTNTINVSNLVNFLEMLRRKDFDGRVILTSSESVYGHQSYDLLPLKETVTPNPVNIYGASKLCQETYVQAYHRSYGLKTVILRSATMFGPYGRLKQAIPIFCMQALKGEDITLEGDGSNSRDFNYVTNMVDAMKLALEKPGIDGEIFNIASGDEIKIGGLVAALRHLLKPVSNSKIVNKPWREGEQGLRVALDISKAREKLGYEPMIKTLDGLRSELLWLASDVLLWNEDQMDKLQAAFFGPNSGRRVGEVKKETDTSREPGVALV